MWQVLKAIIWGALWICGVKLFAELLMLSGAWLMAAGVFTYHLCDLVVDDLFD